MSLSTRIQNLPSSPIRALADIADRRKSQGIDIIHMNIGQPDLKTDAVFFEGIQQYINNNKVVSYANSRGFIELRSAISEFYKQTLNVNISTEEILITNGGSEAILFALQACMDPGDNIIIPTPCYPNYISFAGQSDVEIRTVQTELEDNFHLPSISDFEKLIDSKTKAIMICNPDNPTGKVYSRDELEELRKIVKKHGLFLIIDEVYRELVYSGEIISGLQFEDIKDKVIIIDSASKRFSTCGSRIGWLVCRNIDLINQTLKLAQARLAVPSLEQVGTIPLLKNHARIINSTKEVYNQRRKILITELNNIESVIYADSSQGALYMMVKLPVDNAEKFCRWLIEEFEYKNTTLMLAPGKGFYTRDGNGIKEVRIAYVLDEEKIKLGCEILKKGLEKYTKVN